MSSSTKKGDACMICNEMVIETDKGICCDICELWHHAKCVTMNDNAYKMYKKENLPWVCSECISGRREEKGLHELMLTMMKNAEEEKEERALLMMMIKKMSEQMTSMEKNQKIIEDRINEKIKISEKQTMEKVNESVEEKLKAFREGRT